MKTVITDCRLSPACKASLSSLGYKVIALPPWSALPAPVASHPDMLLFIYRNSVICHRDYYRLAKNEIDRLGMDLVLTDESVENVYPKDILFNAAHVGEHLIGNLKHISSHIKELPLTAVDTKQGYAKCSTCVVSDNAIITADTSIEAAAIGADIDVLKISPGHILLPGYDSGFIGGASGTTDEFVAFCGNIDLHPDADEIRSFCKKHKKEALSLSNEPLFDAGTLFFL